MQIITLGDNSVVITENYQFFFNILVIFTHVALFVTGLSIKTLDEQSLDNSVLGSLRTGHEISA